MWVLLGKRLREDPGLRPSRERAEPSGEVDCEDTVERLARLYKRIPQDEVLQALENSDLGSAAVLLGSLELHAQRLVDHYCGSWPAVHESVSQHFQQYHMSKQETRRQAESLLRDNMVLKRALHTLCEKLQQHREASEEHTRLVQELERERLLRTKLLIRLEQLN